MLLYTEGKVAEVVVGGGGVVIVVVGTVTTGTEGVGFAKGLLANGFEVVDWSILGKLANVPFIMVVLLLLLLLLVVVVVVLEAEVVGEEYPEVLALLDALHHQHQSYSLRDH